METGPFTNCQLFDSIWARESRSSNNCHWASQLPLLTANLQLNSGNLHLLRFGLMRFPTNCSARSLISQVTAWFFGSCTTLSRWYQENGVLLYVKTGFCWVHSLFALMEVFVSSKICGSGLGFQCCNVLCCFQIQQPLPVPLLLTCCPSNWCKKNWYVVYYYL